VTTLPSAQRNDTISPTIMTGIMHEIAG